MTRLRKRMLDFRSTLAVLRQLDPTWVIWGFPGRCLLTFILATTIWDYSLLNASIGMRV
jgi:hypothetical protein